MMQGINSAAQSVVTSPPLIDSNSGEADPHTEEVASAVPTRSHQHGAITLLIALGVSLICFLIQAYRINRAPDIIVDEIVYNFVSQSVSRGEMIREYWFGTNRAFFWQPPLFFLIEGAFLKISHLNNADIFTTLYNVRYLNVGLAALTGGLLFVLGRKLRNISTGLTMVLLFVLDPFTLRSARRNLLEVLTMLLIVLCVLVLSRYPRGLGRWGTLVLGLLFGLVILTKEIAFFVLVLPALFLLLGQPSTFRRFIPSLIVSGMISVLVYSLYPLWAYLTGNWSDFVNIKSFQYLRFSGFIQMTGWNRTSGPSFREALSVNLGQYGSSYGLILIGAALTYYLLLRSRSDIGARLMASWGIVTQAFFAFTILRGQLNDHFFYLLLIPSAAITGYAVPMLLNAMFAPKRLIALINAAPTVLVLITLPALIFYNTILYYSTFATGTDNSMQKVYTYLQQNVTPNSLIMVSGEADGYLFRGYRTTYKVRTPEYVKSNGIHYLVLSSKDVWGRFNGMTPEFYDWVLANSVEQFSADGPTFWHLGVYYMAYPEQGRTTSSPPGSNVAEPPALTPLQLAARPIPPLSDTPTQRYFTQTAHSISGAFKREWEENGAVAIFGYPLTEPLIEAGRTVQYFERARLDAFPEFLGTPDEVQIAPLGRELTATRLQQTPFLPVNQSSVAGSSRYFSETHHSLGGPFRTYWEGNGGARIFGLPISEEVNEINPVDGQPYKVQYFERARFEYHPESKDPATTILLGHLGRQAMIYRGWRP